MGLGTVDLGREAERCVYFFARAGSFGLGSGRAEDQGPWAVLYVSRRLACSSIYLSIPPRPATAPQTARQAWDKMFD